MGQEMNDSGCFLSVDLEDYMWAATLQMGLPRRTAPERTRHGVARILDALAGATGQQRITFFTSGHIAREQPQLVRDLCVDGHEIACRTDERTAIRSLDRAQFGARLHDTVADLEDAAGQRITGFRAPDFSIDQDNIWALETLAEAGFLYDSSLIGAARRAAGTPYDIYSFSGRPIYEFPVYRHVLPGGEGIRVIGGCHLRLLPVKLILQLMRKAVELGYTPVVHIHPSDLDDEFALAKNEMPGVGALARWRWALRQRQWSTGAGRAAWKLEEILKAFPHKGRFIDAVIGDAATIGPAPAAPTTREPAIA